MATVPSKPLDGTQIEQFLGSVAHEAIIVDADQNPPIQLLNADVLLACIDTNGEDKMSEADVTEARKKAVNRVQEQARALMLIASVGHNEDVTKAKLRSMIPSLVERAKLTEKGSAKRKAQLTALVDAIPGDEDTPIGTTQAALAKSKKTEDKEAAAMIKQYLLAFGITAGITQNSIVNFIKGQFSESKSPFAAEPVPFFPDVAASSGKKESVLTTTLLGKLNI